MASNSISSSINKEQVYEFMKIYAKKSVSTTISAFLEKYPNFSSCDNISLHQRLTRVYQRITKYKKAKNTGLLNKFLAEEFTLEGYKRQSNESERSSEPDDSLGDTKVETNVDQMKEINLKLMGYIRTLEYENSELKKALSDDVTKVEETMRHYNDALEAMKTLSDEAEENYDKILKSVHGEENK